MQVSLAILSASLLYSTIAHNSSDLLRQIALLRPDHICVFSADGSNEAFVDFVTNLLPPKSPRTIVTSNEAVVFNGVRRKCSLVVFFAGGSGKGPFGKLLKKLNDGSFWDRLAWYVTVGDGIGVYESFVESVVEYGVVNSLLVGGKVLGYNYFTRVGIELFRIKDALDYLESEKVRNLGGVPFRVYMKHHYVYLPIKITEKIGIYEKLLQTFSQKTDVSVKWARELNQTQIYAEFDNGTINMIPFLLLQAFNNKFDFVPLPTFDGRCFFWK